MSKLLDGLNPAQREAVTHKIGPLLIIAGPGSGKTRTVVHSIAYAIENGVLPEQILAFSFTIKASGELRKRVKEIVGGEKGNLVNISTFHRFCRWVLREDIEKLQEGYTRDFRSLKDNEQANIISNLTRIYEQKARDEIDYIQHHIFPKPEEILNFIKKCKARKISPSEAGSYVPEYHLSEDYVKIFNNYEQRLKSNGWIDYESQQIFTDELFSKVPEVKVKWQDKFELIFVDEYQDTDPVQYRIINSLSEKSQNLRVVGDDDQGIYGFRGADIQNILNFEKDYPNATVISLGQNYRSTQEIVAVTRALADFNPNRREKELFTRNFEGEKVKYFHCENDEIEAQIISSFIFRAINQGGQQPRDFAVLYRTNNQAHAFKRAFRDLGIQYGGVRDSSDVDTNGVSMMTIHKSKGLEFPIVFVVGICVELIPHYYSRDEKDWDEEIRLLYVAMTRAENWLCLSSYKEDDQYSRGKSQFLDYIPDTLLERVENLENIPVPPAPEDMITHQEPSDYIEPLPEQLLGKGMTVIGIDPGNIGTRNTNVGWSVTQKTSDGYSVLDFGTEKPTGTQESKRRQIEQKIRALIHSKRPHAIAIEKLEVATKEAKKEWFLYVAECVATVRRIANEQSIECHLYTPQHVKEAATDKRNASKLEVQKAVKRMCNLPQIPEPHHSADAIAASLCYLRSYLNSSRFEGNKRKMERYNTGCDYIDKRQFDAAIDEFKETLYIDPIFTDAYIGLGRAHIALNDLGAAENAAKKALKLTENNHPESQKLLDAIRQYLSACNSLNNSKWNMAIDKFKEVINQEPIFTEAHCGLSKAYLNLGNLEAAKNAAEEALRLRKNYPFALELLDNVKMKSYDKGKYYFNREEYDQAIIELQRAVKIDADFKDAYLYLGRTCFKLGNLEAAEKEARNALRVDSTYEDASILLGEIKKEYKIQGDDHRNRKAYTDAVKSYQQAIRIDDKYKDAYNNLGIVYRNMNEYSKAISAYQQAINIDDRYEEPHNNLSIVYLETREYSMALSSLRRAITLKPDYQTAYHNLAMTYLKMKNLQDASEAVLKALSLDGNNQNTHKLLKIIQQTILKQAQSFYSRSDLTRAELSAKNSLKLDSSYQPAIDLLEEIKQEYYAKAHTNIEKDDHIAAINLLKKTLEIDPEFREGHYSLGKTCFNIGELEVAESEARMVLRIDPNYEPASSLLNSIKEKYYKRALASLEQKEWMSAEKFAEEALRIDTNYQLASNLLKQTYYEIGIDHIYNNRFIEGIDILKKANDIDPNCDKTHYYLGWAYFKLGRLKEAQLSVKQALSIEPNYLKANALLSEINHPRNWLKLGVANVRHFTRRILKPNQN